MENTTVAIDILRIEKTSLGYFVTYWDENFAGENISAIEVCEFSLWEYVKKNELNIIDVNCPNNGIDQVEVNVLNYLEDNLHEVIKEYITINS